MIDEATSYLISVQAFQCAEQITQPSVGVRLLRDKYRVQICKNFHSQVSVGGVVVNIVAFQAIVPGSIPGRRKAFYFFLFHILLHDNNIEKKQVMIRLRLEVFPIFVLS